VAALPAEGPQANRRGDGHEIRNTGEALLKTLNVYVPPAYTDEREELPVGRA
jgi:oxalate decarboxylase/phosphoglucose isomerase-like protein (cupin superfamily)